MAEASPNQSAGFQLVVSPDRTTVTLAVSARAEVTAAAVIAALGEMKVVGFDRAAVEDGIRRSRGEASSTIVVKGTAAVEARPARIEFRVPVAQGTSFMISKVEAGEVIGTILPPTAGVDGRDVFGRPIAPTSNSKPVVVGRNLNTVKNQIIAGSRGNLRLKGEVLSIEPLLEIRGDDGNGAPVNFDGDAAVKGSLTSGHTLRISGSLTVGGAIEAVKLKTGGSLDVKGGIVDQHKGSCTVGGDLRCRFISGATINASGDVQVQSEIVHSRVTCTGRLTVARGPILGGVVAANGGIECQSLGHSNGTPTIVEAGNSITCQSVFAAGHAQIEANQKHVRDVRAKIKPLLHEMKNLTPQQRERATELLFEADELEADTERMATQIHEQAGVLHEKELAEVVVAEVAHPGVTVRFPGIETVLSCQFKGPLKLVPRKSGGVAEIVLIDGKDQSRSVLPSRPIHAESRATAA
jgi:uncharacterized protein (DUF342 family)